MFFRHSQWGEASQTLLFRFFLLPSFISTLGFVSCYPLSSSKMTEVYHIWICCPLYFMYSVNLCFWKNSSVYLVLLTLLCLWDNIITLIVEVSHGPHDLSRYILFIFHALWSFYLVSNFFNLLKNYLMFHDSLLLTIYLQCRLVRV